MTKQQYMGYILRQLSWFILFSPCLLLAQNSVQDSTTQDSSKFQFRFIIPTTAEYVTMDKLHNIYVVDAKQNISKYDTDGKLRFQYNDNQYGTLTHIDATNPFQTLLYYPDFLRVVVLDRTLSVIQDISLLDLNANLIQTNAISMASDNQLWIYNELDFTLNKLNVLLQSFTIKTDLSQQFSEGLTPTFIMERNNTVWLNDPEKGIFQFDSFGQYIKAFDLKGVQQFEVIHNVLFYQQGKRFFQFNLGSLTTTEILLPIVLVETDQVLIQKNRLLIWQKGGVLVFRF